MCRTGDKYFIKAKCLNFAAITFYRTASELNFIPTGLLSQAVRVITCPTERFCGYLIKVQDALPPAPRRNGNAIFTQLAVTFKNRLSKLRGNVETHQHRCPVDCCRDAIGDCHDPFMHT